MPISYPALATEINTDPANLGYAQFADIGCDACIANLLNQAPSSFTPPQTWTFVEPIISNFTLLIWAASNSVLSTISAGASSTNASIASVCQAVMLMLQGVVSGLDITNSNNLTMISALVTAGILTADQQTSLLSLANQPATRAQFLFGGGVVVQASDVAIALGR
jgi:hypothetical protein